VLEGLELHRGVLTPAEQARVVEAVEHWVALVRSCAVGGIVQRGTSTRSTAQHGTASEELRNK
jgi:hypothetical protein